MPPTKLIDEFGPLSSPWVAVVDNGLSKMLEELGRLKAASGPPTMIEPAFTGPHHRRNGASRTMLHGRWHVRQAFAIPGEEVVKSIKISGLVGAWGYVLPNGPVARLRQRQWNRELQCRSLRQLACRPVAPDQSDSELWI